jgi:hypothetical protein
MPRSLKEILEHADELQQRAERHEPHTDAIKDAAALRALRHAALRRGQAEGELAEAIALARTDGHSWQAIGAMLGTSGEAARQRYGHPARTR